MEKEKKSLGQLTPMETERLVDELESEMRKAGAEFEVNTTDAPRPWYLRLLQRIKRFLGLCHLFVVIFFALLI